MSIHAVSWALRQELPPVPKFVLVALCERANGKTGQCWPGIDEVAEAVCLSERSVVTYIAALVRNGYVLKQAMRGKDGKRRNNHYWICFDREAAPWIGPGGQVEEMPPSESDENEAPETSENDESQPCADFAHGHDVQPASHGPCATAFTLQESFAEPEVIKPSPSPPSRPNRQADPPPGFAPNNRSDEQARLKAAEEARRPKAVFVIKDSRAWYAWVDHKRAILRAANDPRWIDPLPSTCHEGKLGWWMPTLFPQETGPPATGDPPERAKKAG